MNRFLTLYDKILIKFRSVTPYQAVAFGMTIATFNKIKRMSNHLDSDQKYKITTNALKSAARIVDSQNRTYYEQRITEMLDEIPDEMKKFRRVDLEHEGIGATSYYNFQKGSLGNFQVPNLIQLYSALQRLNKKEKNNGH